MKRKAARCTHGMIVAARPTLLTALALLVAVLTGQGQTPRAKTHPLVSSTPQARLRFVPELLTTAAGVAGSESGGEALYYNGINAMSAALPASINSIAFNSKGDLYLIAAYPASLLKINASDGTLSTVLGAYSSCDGESCGETTTVQVALNNSQGVAVSPSGTVLAATDDVFIADTGNHVVYKLNAQNNVTVVAGTVGQSGYSGDGGSATGSLLNQPTGLAFDANGNLYISDAGNSAIRKISATDGKITTIAGGIGYGFAGDGTQAAQAQLKRPYAIAFDPSGNLYFTDTANYVVQKINMQAGDPKAGQITRVAGNLTGGYAGDGGQATDAELSNAEGLAVDAAGQIYIGDTSSQVVRRITLDGTISTIAGIDPYPNIPGFYFDGLPATQAYINSVAGLAFDAKGTLYMSALGIARVLRLGPAGALNFGQQSVGSSATQTLTVVNAGSAAATFSSPAFVVQGTGFTAVQTSSNGCVPYSVLQPGGSCQISVTFSPTSTTNYTTTLGLSEDEAGGPPSADLHGVGVLPATTTMLMLSTQMATAGDAATLSATVARASGTGATPTGTVQFIDSNTGNVLAQGTLNSSGTVSVQTTTIPAGYYYVIAQYGGDAGYAGSASDGMSFEIDAKTAVVSLTSSLSTVSASGTVSLTAHVTSATTGTPTGNVLFQVDGVTAATVVLQNGAAAATVTISTPGQHLLRAVYVGDGVFGQAFSPAVPLSAHGGLLQFVPGAATTVAGTPSDANHGSFSGDGGPATSATMHTPSGVIADAAGNLYIADEQNNVIRKVGVDGTISTFAGIPYAGSYYGTRFGGDGGPATSAYLTNPIAVALDAASNLYIADYSNHAVRRVDATTGIISTFAGVGGHPGYNQDSGTPASTYLNHPSALAFDTAGNLYIVDTGNNLVRKVDTNGNLTTVAGRYGYSGTPVEGGVATMQVLTQPMGVAADTAGNIYIAESATGIVRRVDGSGRMYTFAGGATTYVANQGDGGLATAATLRNPQQMAFDLAGNLYISDAGAGLVRKVDPSGIISTVAGSYTSQAQASHYDPAGADATIVPLLGPSGVSVSPDGSLLVTDDLDQTVWRVGPTGIVQFGPQAAGTTSDPLTVTLFNAGDRPLTFASTPYTVTGDYVVSAGGNAPCSFTAQLAVGASCTIAVQYRPQTGVLRGSIVFAGMPGTPTVTLTTNNNVPQTTTQLYLSGTAINYGDSLQLYGLVAPLVNGPTPSGKLSFYDTSTLLGIMSLSGGAGYIYNSTLSLGTHSLTAVYSGDGYNATSTSDPMSVTVYSPTQTALAVSSSTVSAGTSVRLMATVTSGGTALGSGSVTFSDGSSTIGTANVNASGVAVFSTPALSSGSHSFTAAYNAQGTYGPSISAAVVVTANSGGGGGSTQGLDYALNLSPVPIVLHRGETKTIAVTASQFGANYQGNVPLACGTLPSYVTCSFSPATLIVGGPVQNLTSMLTITSSAGHATNSRPVQIVPANLVKTRP